MKFDAAIEVFPLAKVFAISRGARTEAEVVRVSLSAGEFSAHGECVPYARYGETCASVLAQLEGVRDPFDIKGLQNALPPGAARNALDCALWDLAAKRSGKRIWELFELPTPMPLVTAYTLSLDSPAAMEAEASKNSDRPLLKTKLGGSGDVDRIVAVRNGAPDARIIVDANEGWTPESYQEIAPELVNLGVEMVEQPFPAGDDDALTEIERVLPVCADESCHSRESLSDLEGKYDMINIKLDKTGGLSEALALRSAARKSDFKVMVGCMVGTSLGMAPATLVAQKAAITDLDGPLLLARDRENGLTYDQEGVHPPSSELWG